MKRRLLVFLVSASALCLVAFVLVTVSCNQSTDPRNVVAATEPAKEATGPPFFREVTADSGIHFTYENGEKAENFAILESLGGGIGLLDYNGDGLLDIFIPGGGYFAGDNKHDIRGRPCKLYKNLGNYQFKDVTKEVGLEDFPWFYSHGVAIGDYDRDGWPDILLTGWGKVALFHNEPVDPNDPAKGRKFVDVTEKAGLTGITWATSAGWADFDGDGFPDLYVCQYVDWSFEKNHPTDCKYDGSSRDVCPPKKFSGLQGKLFTNNQNGTFTDRSKEVGLNPGGPTASKSLGVLLVAMRGHGRADIYVANDTVPKFLYQNQCEPGKFRFSELGVLCGATLSESGESNGSMGQACADWDDSGKPALFVTNYQGEMNALYKNLSTAKKISFIYNTKPAGLGAIDQVYVGWGCGFLDLDHHGWEDLFFANGHAIRFPKGAGVTRSQRPILLRNSPNEGRAEPTRVFKEISARGGDYFDKPHQGRGVAFGDLTNSGRIDLVVSHLNEPVSVLRNVADVGQNHWLGVELVGKNHADVVGARVSAVVGDRTLTRFATGGGSYASSGDRRHVFGLGDAEKVSRLSVLWPDGSEEHFDKNLAFDNYYRITQGQGKAEALPKK